MLGEGGAARVYRVRHIALGTVHALKVLTVDHPTLRKRLLAEGRAQAQLSHPNLVPVRDVLELPGGPALLMDFVPGPTLQDRINEGPLPLDELLRLFSQTAAGVAYAHSEGLIHRDIKPSNVLLDQSQEPALARVTDFGLVMDVDSEHTRHTRVGMAMGTLGYMAPEQIRDARSADARTDIFALGALLYSMLMGRPPFEGSDQLEIMNATAQGLYAPLNPGLPKPVIAVIERCLQVEPAARFESVEALLQALGGSAVEQVSAPDGPPLTPTPPSPSRQRLSPAPDTLSRLLQTESDHEDTIAGIVVDREGRGHVVQIAVQIDPDGSGVHHAPGVARDAQVAAQLAVAVALGGDASDVGVTWTVRGNTDTLHGTSLGLPLAIALRCAHLSLQVPQGWAFTGGVDLDGRIAPVSGVPAKVRAAAAAGLTQVAVPADGLGSLSPPAGLSVVPVRTFARLMDRLHPQAEPERRRPWGRRMLLLLVPLLAAFTGLSSRLDPLLQDPLLRAIHGPLPADNTAILAFPPQRDARALRAQHPAVIDSLVVAGARCIFFDVTMVAQTEHDLELAQAIERAKAAGVVVVLPVVMEGGQVMLPESEALQSAAVFGPVLAQADTSMWHVRRAQVRIRTLHMGDFWHAAVLAAQGHLSTDRPPRIDQDTLVIGPTRNPVWADLLYLHPVQESMVLQYGQADLSAVAGRTVLIGEMGGSDDVHLTDAETVYGIEIEAALVETLLQQRAPRVASPEIDSLLALVLGLLTATVGLILPRRLWLLALLVPVAAGGIAVALVVAGVLISLLPLALSAAIGMWVGRTPVVTLSQTHS
jgi:hypothetical protein